jgi:hypothetical protein
MEVDTSTASVKALPGKGLEGTTESITEISKETEIQTIVSTTAPAAVAAEEEEDDQGKLMFILVQD